MKLITKVNLAKVSRFNNKNDSCGFFVDKLLHFMLSCAKVCMIAKDETSVLFTTNVSTCER